MAKAPEGLEPLFPKGSRVIISAECKGYAGFRGTVTRKPTYKAKPRGEHESGFYVKVQLDTQNLGIESWWVILSESLLIPEPSFGETIKV